MTSQASAPYSPTRVTRRESSASVKIRRGQRVEFGALGGRPKNGNDASEGGIHSIWMKVLSFHDRPYKTGTSAIVGIEIYIVGFGKRN
jgi:hypothetical protein